MTKLSYSNFFHILWFAKHSLSREIFICFIILLIFTLSGSLCKAYSSLKINDRCYLQLFLPCCTHRYHLWSFLTWSRIFLSKISGCLFGMFFFAWKGSFSSYFNFNEWNLDLFLHIYALPKKWQQNLPVSVCVIGYRHRLLNKGGTKSG